MLVEKESQKIIALDKLPQILALNVNAEPIKWIDYVSYSKLLIKNKILWSLGSYEIVLRGGINAVTGKQSKLVIDTIVAVNTNKSPYAYRNNIPTFNREAVYLRDRNLCAYCLMKCDRHNISIDHVLPISKGGVNNFLNTVTSCKHCNNLKGDYLLSNPNCPVQLFYYPYEPNLQENFILKNRNILTDQREFLMKKVPKNSRLYN